MILVDANILIYAINQDAREHIKARRWLEQTLSSDAELGLAWIVVLAFLRITTHPSVLAHPIPVARAIEYLENWISQPFVETVSPGPNHWRIFRNLLEVTGTGGNLTSDTHLAALALEQGGIIYSADNDFKRFSGVQHINPLAL